MHAQRDRETNSSRTEIKEFQTFTAWASQYRPPYNLNMITSENTPVHSNTAAYTHTHTHTHTQLGAEYLVLLSAENNRIQIFTSHNSTHQTQTSLKHFERALTHEQTKLFCWISRNLIRSLVVAAPWAADEDADLPASIFWGFVSVLRCRASRGFPGRCPPCGHVLIQWNHYQYIFVRFCLFTFQCASACESCTFLGFRV